MNRIKSKEQFFEELVSKVASNTDITNFSAGSQVATLLEGVATKLFQLNLDNLKLLETNSIDAMSEESLEQYAKDISLPNYTGGIGRTPAIKAVGDVLFKDSSFIKKTLSFYTEQHSPFGGSTIIYINADEIIPSSGVFYISRGSPVYERVVYTNRIEKDGFYTVFLSSPLKFSHEYTDAIVLAQGGDRVISSGLEVFAGSVSFVVKNTITILDGEDSIFGLVEAQEYGAKYNIKQGAVTSISPAPFSGIEVSNLTPIQNGADVESTQSLRNRIKGWQKSLSRGTTHSIIERVRNIKTNGIMDISYKEGDTGGISTFFVDTKEYSYDIIPIFTEILTNNAYKRKEFKLSKPPTPICFTTSSIGNLNLSELSDLQVEIDGEIYKLIIDSKYFRNLSNVTIYELINCFNEQMDTLHFLLNANHNKIVILAHESVSSVRFIQSDLQLILSLPTDIRKRAYVYVNNELQNDKDILPTLKSNFFSLFNRRKFANGLYDNVIKVDNSLITFDITNDDFKPYGTNILTSTIEQWALVLDIKIAGCSVTAVNEQLVIKNTNTNRGTIDFISGDMIANDSLIDTNRLSVKGVNKDYTINITTGDILFHKDLPKYSNVTVGMTPFYERETIESYNTDSVFVVNSDPYFQNAVVISSNNTVIKPIPQTDLSSAKFEIENGLLKITDLSYKEMFVNIEPNDRLVINIDKTRNPVDTILSSSVFYEYDIATANEIETTVVTMRKIPFAEPTARLDWDFFNGIYDIAKKDGNNIIYCIVSPDIIDIVQNEMITSTLNVTNGMFNAFTTDGFFEYVPVPNGSYTVQDMVSRLNNVMKYFIAYKISDYSFVLSNAIFNLNSLSTLFTWGSVTGIIPKHTSTKEVYHVANIGMEVSTLKVDSSMYPEAFGLSSSLYAMSGIYNDNLYKGSEDLETQYSFEDGLEYKILFNLSTPRPHMDTNYIYGSFGTVMSGASVLFGDGLNINNKTIRMHKTLTVDSILEHSLSNRLNVSLKDESVLDSSESSVNIFNTIHPLKNVDLSTFKITNSSSCKYTHDGDFIKLKLGANIQGRVCFSMRLPTNAGDDYKVDIQSQYNNSDAIVDTVVVYTLASTDVIPVVQSRLGILSFTYDSTPLVSNVAISSNIPSVPATVDANGVRFTSKLSGASGNGTTIRFIDNSISASVSSGVTGITYTAIEGGVYGNGVKVITSDNGTGGLSISDNMTERLVTINLGGQTDVTRSKLKAVGSNLIEFTGEGYSSVLLTHAEQELTGGVGNGLIVSEDMSLNLVTINLGGDEFNPAHIVSAIGSSMSLVSSSQLGVIPSSYTEADYVLFNGVDSSEGFLSGVVAGDMIKISSTDNDIPSGEWLITGSDLQGNIICKIPRVNPINKVINLDSNNICMVLSYKQPTLTEIYDHINDYIKDSNLSTVLIESSDFTSVLPISTVSYMEYTGTLPVSITKPIEAVKVMNIRGSTSGSATIISCNTTSQTVTVSKDSNFSCDVGDLVHLVPYSSYSVAKWLSTPFLVNTNKYSVGRSGDYVHLYNNEFIQIQDSPFSKPFYPINDGVLHSDCYSMRLLDLFSTQQGDLLRLQQTKSKNRAYNGSAVYGLRNKSLYSNTNLQTARISILREGQLENEVIKAGASLTFTKMDEFNVRITLNSYGKIPASVGDTLIIPNNGNSSFPTSIVATVNSSIEYSKGAISTLKQYGVVSVISESQVVVSMTIPSTFTVTLNQDADMVFLPSLYTVKASSTTAKGRITYIGKDIYALYLNEDLKLNQKHVQVGDTVTLGIAPLAHLGKHVIVSISHDNKVVYFYNQYGLKSVTDKPNSSDFFINICNSEFPLLFEDRASVDLDSVLSIPHKQGEWFDSSMIGSFSVSNYGYTCNLGIPSVPVTKNSITFFIEISKNNNASTQPVKTDTINGITFTNSVTDDFVFVHGVGISNQNKIIYTTKPRDNVTKNTVVNNMSKMKYEVLTSEAVGGYNTVTGLFKEIYNSINGNTYYDSYRAVGTRMIFLPPTPRFIKLKVSVKTTPNVLHKEIADKVRVVVLGYFDQLSVGNNVVLSSIESKIHNIPDIVNVSVSTIEADFNREVYIGSGHKAYLRLEDLEIN